MVLRKQIKTKNLPRIINLFLGWLCCAVVAKNFAIPDCHLTILTYHEDAEHFTWPLGFVYNLNKTREIYWLSCLIRHDLWPVRGDLPDWFEGFRGFFCLCDLGFFSQLMIRWGPGDLDWSTLPNGLISLRWFSLPGLNPSGLWGIRRGERGCSKLTMNHFDSHACVWFWFMCLSWAHFLIFTSTEAPVIDFVLYVFPFWAPKKCSDSTVESLMFIRRYT